MLRRFLLFITLSSLMSTIHAQWDYYEATWEGKPGSVVINMDWRNYAPIADLPYLLELVINVDDCSTAGFVEDQESKLIERFSTQVDSLLSISNYLESVGTMTHDCTIRDFYYINDTIGVSQALKKIDFINTYQVRLIRDSEWRGYLHFLYPDAYLQQTMVNAKTVKELILAGDDVNKKRRILHFAGFVSSVDREKFRIFILEQGFRIDEETYDLKSLAPYQFSFSRKDKPAVDWISEITLKLADKASSLNGAYDGWQVEY